MQVVRDVGIEKAQIFSHFDVGQLFSTVSPCVFVDPGNRNLQDCGDFLNRKERTVICRHSEFHHLAFCGPAMRACNPSGIVTKAVPPAGLPNASRSLAGAVLAARPPDLTAESTHEADACLA